MTSSSLPVTRSSGAVDQAKVQAHLRELAHDLEKGALSWIVPRFLGLSAAGMVFTVLVPAVFSGDLGTILDSSDRLFWARWLLPVVLSAPSVVGAYYRNRKRLDRGVASLCAEMQRQVDQMTGTGWLRRTLRIGTGLTAAVGGTVGLMMAMLFPLAELPGGSRILAFAGFVGMTALWAFPAAFGIRAVALKNHGPFLQSGTSGAQSAMADGDA